MKKYLIIPLLLFPSISLASPLTQEQASSLIRVVQSSPGTPASAFTDLITAFSNITVNQANSLITVVQSAPGVPANSFVGLLIAFTEDQPVPVPIPAPKPITPLVDKSGITIDIQGPTDYGKSFENTPYGRYTFKVKILDKDGTPKDGMPVLMQAPDNLYPNSGVRYTNTSTLEFLYVPTQTGTKLISFSSEGRVKEVYIEVK